MSPVPEWYKNGDWRSEYEKRVAEAESSPKDGGLAKAIKGIVGNSATVKTIDPRVRILMEMQKELDDWEIERWKTGDPVDLKIKKMR